MKNYSSIIVTGSVGYDSIMDFPGKFVDHFHPEHLHQINISFVVSRLEKQLGGSATNIAYNVSLANLYLGNKTPIIPLAAVGKDGKTFINFFKKNNIDARGMLVDRLLYSSSGNVITDTKDNQIWGYYYGASKSSKKIRTKKFADSKSIWIISANHPEAFLHFQREAIINNNTYIYDPGMALSWIDNEDLKGGVLHAQYLVGNDYEIAMILKRLNVSINQLIEKGVQTITTLGEKGVRLEVQVNKVHKLYKVSAYKVNKVIDPTGAGDAWRGGFIGGLVAGYHLQDCLKLGNVLASFAVETYGTVNHKPSKRDIAKRLKTL